MDDRHDVRTIEQTAKRWKAWEAGGWLAAFAGLGLMAVNGWLGVACSFAGLVTIIYAKIGGWWHHG